MILPIVYYENLIRIYEEKGDPSFAERQMKYMRNQFAYYGLRAPIWVGVLKEEFKNKGKYRGLELKEFVHYCYENEYREINYSAIQMIQKVQKNEDEDFIELLEYLIVHKSWWDTVDWIAKLVGIHFKLYPGLIAPTAERWIADENIWLKRTALIFQLFYKENTDHKRLFSYIRYCKDTDEFFIQKAMGWALRQYSKIDGEAVRKFIIANEDLPKLTKREGLRLIQ